MFKCIKPTRVSDQIVEQINRLLLKGKLEPGQRLPSEAELAEKFGVSRATVREALSALESDGVVERSKNGTFIRRYSIHRILDAVDFPRKLDHELFADLLEARMKLELQIIDLACQRADEVDLLKIELALGLMEKDLLSGQVKVESDIMFHQCLAVATKNQVLAGLARSIGQMLKDMRSKTLLVPGRLSVCLQEHRAIYEAIKNRDSELGCKLIQEHLEAVQGILDSLHLETRGEG